MKRHSLFFATALAVASLGAAGLAVAQSPSAGGKGHVGHHGGHAMRGGIERMDSDGDGRISRAEFDAARAAREEARAARMAEREKAGAESPRRARAEGAKRGEGGPRRGARMAFDFDAIDADKDGYIVRGEVTAHRERMRAQMATGRAERLAEAFTAADLNRDGKLSRVEVDEKMPRLAKRFAWMDDNRDGFLDRAELEAGKRR